MRVAAWIHADDRALSDCPLVQMEATVVDRECQHVKRFRCEVIEFVG